MSERFIKYIPSEKSAWLRKNHTSLYLLLSLAAERARWIDDFNDGLLAGDAILGSFEEAGISRQQYRDALDKGEKLGIWEVVYNQKCKKLLETPKRTIKRTIKSVVVNIKRSEIWDLNLNRENQQNNQQGTNREPTGNHKQERIKNDKEDHHPNPSSSKIVAMDDEDLMDEDFFLSEENAVKDPKVKHNRNYRTSKNQSLRDKKTEELFEIYPDICISLEILTECKNALEKKGIKGTLENIKFGVAYIMTSKKRSFDITDWPNALKTWKISYPSDANDELENLAYARALEALNSSGHGWCCEVSIEPKKNQKGLYFYNTGQGGASIFLTTEDSNFIKKADDILKAKNMKIPKQKKQGIA